MARGKRNTPARAAEEETARLKVQRYYAAVHVRDWWTRRQMRPGFRDSTSHNTREEIEGLIADLEAGA
jgi:hypothetical protein